MKFIVYQDQLEGGLRFSLDPFVKLFLNRYNISPRQLHPNSYRILTGYIELIYREGVKPDFDMLRHMYSLNKKNGELAFSLAVVSSLNSFTRLKDLPKTWRHRYFVIEYPLEFCSIRHLWVDECHKIKRPQLPSVYLKLAIKLHQRYLAEGTYTSNYSHRYVQRMYPQNRVTDGEYQSFRGIF